MAPLSEVKEKELVEKVELRIALSDSSEKFEQTLDIFLAPLLLKLSSPHASVKQAVLNILKDVLSRLNVMTTVKLPVEKLLLQAQNPPSDSKQDMSAVRLYCLLLISKGIDRIDADYKKQLIPTIMKGISALPLSAAPRLFHILCKLLLSWKPPLKGTKEEDYVREFLNLEDANDLEFLLNYFTKFFLLSPAKPDPRSGIIPRGYSCPGLCADDVSFFTYTAGVTFTKEQMLRFKTAIFKFVTTGFVPNDQMLVKFLSVVSSDGSDLSESANHLLKTLKSAHEDLQFIDYLISLYIGDKTVGRPPVKPELQERILSILNHSDIATQDRKKVLLICSIGLHSSHYKLRSLCLTFIRFVAKHNYQNLSVDYEQNVDEGFSTNIASLIRNNLHTEGWPKLQVGSSTPNFNKSILQRRLQYETLGDVLSKDFELIEDLSFIEFLFDSLRGDMSDFRASIQEALTGLTIHLSKLPSSSKEKLKKLLYKFLYDDNEIGSSEGSETKDSIMSCRYVCIKFANAAFDFADAEGRLLNILGTARTNRFDIIEESYKGLHPYWFRVNAASNTTEFKATGELLGSATTEIEFPRLEDILHYFLVEIKKSENNHQFLIRKSLTTVARFIKQTIISNAVFGKTTIVLQDEEWSLRIEKAVEIDETVSKLLFNYMENFEECWLSEYIMIMHNEFVLKDKDGKQVCVSDYQDMVFGQTLLLLLKFCNRNIIRSVESQIPSLFNYLKEFKTKNDKDLEIAANSLGILASNNLDSSDIKNIINSLTELEFSDETYPVIYANTYIIPRLYLLGNMSHISMESMGSYLNTLLSYMDNQKYKKSTPKLISQFCKHGTLSAVSKQERGSFLSKIIELLQPRLLNDEFSMEALGSLSLYADEYQLAESIFEKIFESHNTSQIELLFTAGESLSVLSGGWLGKFLIRQIDIPNISIPLGKQYFGTSEVDVLEKILEACDSTKPSLRKASCIWLLSLVQYNGFTGSIKTHCREIHLKFMRFLADREEFVQESASRGLSLIYELGNNDIKEDMIKGLLKSFTDSTSGMKMSSGSVSDDSQLFDSGVLNTGDDSVKTYKDILNLASEIGDPSLVYKFMPLAKSSSLWSSRKGIAFGLGAIMSKASLEDMLLKDTKTADKLIPKLYRYRFDPYQTVSNSMNDIWNTLISDSSSVINLYFDQILEELLASMSNKEWRVREASTIALLNLIQTQPKEKFGNSVVQIWTMSFRTMDDIKESVRQAGTKLTTVLAKLLARSIDINNGVSPETSNSILSIILPFLLGTKGLDSDAEEVRNFALNTLVDLIKTTGTTMKGFAPQLVYDFTLLFSSIEPQVINYLALNAENYKVDANLIDSQRKNVVANSPLFDAIEKLILMSDNSVMVDHINNAIKAVRKSVGLPSKVAASVVLTLLVQKYQTDLKSFGGKLLKVCFNAFDDRNNVIRQSFAVSYGYVNRVVSLDKAVKYANEISEKYFSDSNPDSKRVVGTAIEAVIKYAHSQFENVASIYMPLLFVASNDSEVELRRFFTDIWTEASTSGSGTVKLYLEEIMKLLSTNISLTDFSIRRTCAKSVSSVCQKVDSSINEENIFKLFEITLKSLEGRSWDGKEIIVEALVSLVTKFKYILTKNQDIQSSVTDCLVTETLKKNENYVRKIIFSYITYMSIICNDEMISNLISVSGNIINSIESSLFEDVEDKEKTNNRIKTHSDISKKSSKENTEKEEYIIILLKACATVCKRNDANGYPLELFSFVIEKLMSLFESDKIIYTWRTQLGANEIGIEILENYTVLDYSNEFEEMIKLYWGSVFKYNSSKEAIENVKLNLVLLANKLLVKVPSMKSLVEVDLLQLSEQDLSPRIVSDLKNLGISM